MKKKQLDKNTVIITGASGFIGRHLIPIFLKHNYTILALCRNKEKLKKFEWYKDVISYEIDIDKEKFKIPIKNISGMIHLAWQNLPIYSHNLHVKKNFPSNLNFIKQFVSQGLNKVLVTGTCLEYGKKNGAMIAYEKTTPITNYGIAKDKLRESLFQLSKEKKVKIQWARLFYMYGNGQHPNSLYSKFNEAIANNSKIFDMSMGDQMRDYLKVEDVALKLYELFISDQAGIFNVCSGKPIQIKELVNKWIRMKKTKIQLNLGKFKYPDHEAFSFWGVSNIKYNFYLPSLPNAPLKSLNDKQKMGPVCLRHNEALDFLENESFEDSLIDYSNNYENSQAYSPRFYKHMNNVLEILKKEFPKNSLVVEVGCGKGDFVKLLADDAYFKVKGFDASYEGNNTLIEKRYLDKNDRIRADIVVLRHVLEHIPNPFAFLLNLFSIFGNTPIYIEVPNSNWILKNQTFFDITYEHVNYFSTKALKSLFDDKKIKSSLLFEDQYQFVISNLSKLNVQFEKNYYSKQWNYKSFNELFPNVEKLMQKFNFIANGRNIYLWGAATKGCLFLSHCHEKKYLINNVRFAIDLNPNKIGKFLPKSNIPIRNKKDFFSEAKEGDLLIISNPAYQEEIINDINKNLNIKIKISVL